MARTLTYYSPQYVSDVATPQFKIVFGASPNWLETIEGLGAPDINLITQGLPLQNGAQFSRAQYQPRVITITGKLYGTITAQNTAKAAISTALAFNNAAVKESWTQDFWRLRQSDSGIATSAQFIDFLFNTGGLGVLKYTSDGITTTKRINAVPYSGPAFANKDGRQPYQDFLISFICPSPFFEDDAYTEAFSETDDVKTVDFTILGDVAPRAALYVEGTDAAVSNSLAVTITGKQNYTPCIAATGYVPIMFDMASGAAIKDGDLLYQSMIPGEKQSYIDRYANRLAVMVGNSVQAYSIDGLNWITASTVLAGTWYSSAWSPLLNIFVMVRDNGQAYSVDGLNWIAATTSLSVQSAFVVWSQTLNLFVFVGVNTQAYSVDGKNWIAATTVLSGVWRSVAWSPSLGLFSMVSNTSQAYSVDGKNWIIATAALSVNSLGVAWSPSLRLFALVGDSVQAYSVDGKTWTNATTILPGVWKSTSWSPSLGLFVMAGTNLQAYSTDGKNWITGGIVLNKQWYSSTWSPPLGLFLMVSLDNSQAYSTDGKNWTYASTVLAGTWYGTSAFPDTEAGFDTNASLTRFKSIDMPPGAYRVSLTAQKVMVWKLYYRKAWLGV